MAGITLASGNLNIFFNGQIEAILHEFDLSLLKDRKKQQELEDELNQRLPIGTWTIQLTGNTIRIILTAKDRRTKIIWSY